MQETQHKRVGWLDSATFDLHATGPGHPEQPARLHAIREALARRGLDSQLAYTQAPKVDLNLLARVHVLEHVHNMRTIGQNGGAAVDADTRVTPFSFEAATRAAGAVVEATQRVLTGTWDRAFCSVRPPGHHALPGQAMGFCLFDNIACGAVAALEHGDIQRVAILDWDLHHGNGTQAIFYEEPRVLYASWHQYPHYPGTGALGDTGAGAGVGTTINCPVAAGGGDTEYWRAWTDRIRPALQTFAPQMLFISAGFDADQRDPLGGLCVTPTCFAALSEAVRRWADDNCSGRIVSALEGGYNLEALGEDVSLHVQSLL